ncbi:hypothetical protein KDH_26130 [Dictyobacter sp. S3.2.2.5]|uniref:GtrA/DPMS transmembrane domain-containing protein n=1 Tax=Dictyobacter halimunensis TaxID=3026934 RepID=A0ABQ6FNG0_9CHLR|nr:hypothetical protein KDH_26130 [Dictyobacter sp. S3.2.2.5]
MIALLKRLLKIRIVRYALVGGVGILINEGALFCFMHLLALGLSTKSVFLYPISWFCAFEISNLTNFTLNQFFTYSEQVKDIHGWEWVRRAFKGQLASISAMLISLAVSWVLYFTLHIDPYIASFIGMVAQFFYNFFISNKLVFRAIEQKSVEPVEDAILAVNEME